MKKIFLTFVAAVMALTVMSQAIVTIPVNQNPVFEVSTNHLEVIFPENTLELVIGADVVISGGSGSYIYRWTDGEGNELGTDAQLYISGPGVYSLDVVDTCDCLQNVIFSVGTTSVGEITASPISISPNPSDGHIQINGFEPVSISAVNMAGHLAAAITSGSGQTIYEADLSRLPSGIYLLTLTDATGRSTVARMIIK